MDSYMLKYNKDKSKLTVFSSKQYRKKTENLYIKVESSYTKFYMSEKSRSYTRYYSRNGKAGEFYM